jgi:hypothetical protein
MPNKIMIIRHAEKPTDNPPPHGITLHGEHDKESLSVHGWMRAGALVTFFAPPNGQFQNPHIATPDLVYAARIAPGSESRRIQQTVTPLLDKLGKQARANFDFSKPEFKELIASALEEQGVILICWEHERIPHIARHIPLSAGSTTPVPQEWDSKRYDLVWVFDSDARGGYIFTPLPQLLLPGDTPV